MRIDFNLDNSAQLCLHYRLISNNIADALDAWRLKARNTETQQYRFFIGTQLKYSYAFQIQSVKKKINNNKFDTHVWQLICFLRC